MQEAIRICNWHCDLGVRIRNVGFVFDAASLAFCFDEALRLSAATPSWLLPAFVLVASLLGTRLDSVEEQAAAELSAVDLSPTSSAAPWPSTRGRPTQVEANALSAPEDGAELAVDITSAKTNQ